MKQVSLMGTTSVYIGSKTTEYNYYLMSTLCRFSSLNFHLDSFALLLLSMCFEKTHRHAFYANMCLNLPHFSISHTFEKYHIATRIEGLL